MARRSTSSVPSRSPFVPAIAWTLLLVALIGAVSVAHSAGAGAAPRTAPVHYLEPVVGGVIVDRFRPPPTPYGAGNRGVDEWVSPNTPVAASAAGEVLFAGEVAGTLHVTIGHPDGLRTSYSFLAVILVRRGDRVAQGAIVGLAGGLVHFGVRDPSGRYLDPEALWAGRPGAHLVPGPDDSAPSSAATEEAAVVAGDVRRRHRSGADRVLALAIEAAAAHPGLDVARLGREVVRWGQGQAGCTPATQGVPPPAGRRVVILVGGLGSSAGAAAVDRVDLVGLGYQRPDVIRFSYRGGRVPDPEVERGPLASIGATSYDPADTTGDLRIAATRLRALIAAVHRGAPGVPVDLIAHSQGGVVARLALSSEAEPRHPGGARPGASVDLLVTLATPHQGAELATAIVGLGRGGDALADRLGDGAGGVEQPVGSTASGSAAVAQLSEGSDVVAELARPLPAGLRVLSVGASGDLTVPAGATSIPGAANVVVHLGGLHAHDRLPSRPEVTREIALVRAGMAPTCVPWDQGVGDVVTAHQIARAESALGWVAAGVAGP